MPFTKEQTKAIEHLDGELLVSAAAGSGKTAVLVERTLRLLRSQSPRIPADRLMIVTFTRAAAASLRAKLARRLESELAASPADAAWLRRQRTWLQRAAICTIDSYCLKLVQENFSRLQDVPPDFTTTNSAARQRAECLGETLEEAYENNPDFCRFSDLYGKGRTDEAAAEAVLKLHEFLTTSPDRKKTCREFYDQWVHAESIRDTSWGRYLLKKAQEYAETAKVLSALSFADVQGNENFKADWGTFEADARQLSELFEVIRQANEGEKSWDDCCKTLELVQFGKIVSRKKDPVRSIVMARREQCKKMRDLLTERIFVCSEAQFAEDRQQTLPLMEALLRVTWDYNDRLWKAKLRDKTLEFSDLERLALELLCQDGQPTELAREIQSRFDAVMVDEYQDTNALQDALYTCLSRNRTNLMMVGDLKQSIYGFRQAEPGIFSEKLEEYAPMEQGAEGAQKLFMDANFRSAPGVLKGINAVFEPIFTKELGGVLYDEAGQLLVPGFGEDGYDGYEGSCSFHLVSGRGKEADAVWVAKKIRSMKKEGFQVRTEDSERETMGLTRDVRYEDFCILLRSRSAFEVYAKALDAEGIPVYVARDENILESPAVMPMDSLLRVLDNPAQDVHLAAVMMRLGGFDAGDLARIRAEAPFGSFYGAVERMGRPAAEPDKVKAGTLRARTQEFLKELNRLQCLARTLPLDQLMDELFLSTGWLAAVGTLPEGADRQQELRRFAAFVADNASSGLAGVIRSLDALADKGIEGEDQGQKKPGCVTIMTIHKSKGLEFPVVFAADLGHAFNRQNQRDNLQLHRELGIGFPLRDNEGGTYVTLPMAAIQLRQENDETSEEMRVLYVALTRARDALVMSMNASRPKTRPADWILNKTADLLGRDSRPLPALLECCQSFGAWSLYSLLSHPEASALRVEAAGIGFAPRERHKGEPFTFEVCEPPEPPEEASISPADLLGDEEIVERLKKQFDWQPPAYALQDTPAKVSVTALVHGEAGEGEEEEFVNLDRPAFLQKDKISAAERGTVTHAFMQHADWDVVKEQGLEAEIERQQQQALLLSEVAAKLDKKAILTFFESPAFDRVRSAQREYREYAYITSARIMGPDGGDTLIQGVADLVLEYEDHIEILDYKTDHGKSEQKLLEIYRPQLLLYARAIGPRFKKPVGRLTIYSFSLGKEIPVPLEGEEAGDGGRMQDLMHIQK